MVLRGIHVDLKQKANQIRLKTFEIMHAAGGGHLGGSLSCIEILTVLYYAVMNFDAKKMNNPNRDRFVLAKGHAGPPLYAVLADIGCIDSARLGELDKNGGSLPKHVDRLKVEGIEYSSGPLGQGLSVAAGMAAAFKSEGTGGRVYVLLGDGECDEGQVWEAAMSASHFHLDCLTAIVDYNKCQVDGDVADIMNLEPFPEKWKSFGWHVIAADGHDVDKLCAAFREARNVTGKPSVIIAHTTKGKGVSFMEGKYAWHSGKMSDEQFSAGIKELTGMEA
jgi:transketolase